MALVLEAFDAPPAAPEPLGPSAEWAAGHAAGLADGRAEGAAAAAAEGAALSAELAQRLQEVAFGYAEAREEVLRSLRPLFRALADRLLPALAAEALGPWLAEAWAEAARADSDRPLVLAVHPDRVEAVRACLPGGFPARLGADAGLGPNAARLAQDGRETALDLDACVDGLREALAALLDPATSSPRKAHHG